MPLRLSAGNDGLMKKAMLVTVLMGLPLLFLGGTVYAWGTREPAVALTHERAVALFNAMETYAGTTALDRADEATRYPGVTVMVARNTPGGQEIVLKIRAASDRRNNFDWWPAQNAHHVATRCYRWTESRLWGTAGEVDCPDHRDIDPSRAPHTGQIDSRVDGEVERALSRSRSAAVVRQQLAGVEDATVQDVDGTIAVAVTRISGYDSGRAVRDCLLGYRAGEVVRVWRPSAEQVAPGEASCDPEDALTSSLQTPPH
jgi:hypothetical protein